MTHPVVGCTVFAHSSIDCVVVRGGGGVKLITTFFVPCYYHDQRKK